MPTASSNYYHGIGMIDDFDVNRLLDNGVEYSAQLWSDSKRYIDQAAERRLAELARVHRLDQEQVDAQLELANRELESQYRNAVAAAIRAPAISGRRLTEQISHLQQKFEQDKANAYTKAQTAKATRALQQKRIESDELALAKAAKEDYDAQFSRGQLPWQQVMNQAKPVSKSSDPLKNSVGAGLARDTAIRQATTMPPNVAPTAARAMAGTSAEKASEPASLPSTATPTVPREGAQTQFDDRGNVTGYSYLSPVTPPPVSKERYDPRTDLYTNSEGVPEPAYGGKAGNAIDFLRRAEAEKNANLQRQAELFYATPEGKLALQQAEAAWRKNPSYRKEEMEKPGAGFIPTPVPGRAVGAVAGTWADPAYRAKIAAAQSGNEDPFEVQRGSAQSVPSDYGDRADYSTVGKRTQPGADYSSVGQRAPTPSQIQEYVDQATKLYDAAQGRSNSGPPAGSRLLPNSMGYTTGTNARPNSAPTTINDIPGVNVDDAFQVGQRADRAGADAWAQWEAKRKREAQQHILTNNPRASRAELEYA